MVMTRSNAIARAVVPMSLLLSGSGVGASTQSVELNRRLGDLSNYYALPASGLRDDQRTRFAELATQWRRETQWLSSTTAVAMHPAYQSIIGMGTAALPFILENLRDESGHWFWALKAISNADPVPPADRGSVKKMKAAWLRWGRAKGLIGP